MSDSEDALFYHSFMDDENNKKAKFPGIFKKLLEEGKITFPKPKSLDDLTLSSSDTVDATKYAAQALRNARSDYDFVFGQCKGLNHDELLKLQDPISAFDYLTAKGYKLDMLTGRYFSPL